MFEIKNKIYFHLKKEAIKEAVIWKHLEYNINYIIKMDQYSKH